MLEGPTSWWVYSTWIPLPLEGEHGLAADVDPGVERGEVEVATLVEDFGRAVLRLGGAEVEVLELGADEVVVEPHLPRSPRARRMVQRGSPS